MQSIDNLVDNVVSLTTEAFGTFLRAQLGDQTVQNALLDVMDYQGKKTVNVYARTAQHYYIINFWKTAIQEEMGSTVITAEEASFLANL